MTSLLFGVLIGGLFVEVIELLSHYNKVADDDVHDLQRSQELAWRIYMELTGESISKEDVVTGSSDVQQRKAWKLTCLAFSELKNKDLTFLCEKHQK